ncbi:MAG: c-type cytochrome [Pseudomonadota bacterium]
MLPKIAKLLLLMAAAAMVHAQDLTEEQRADIEARIAPVGTVCLQGENCGGLPLSSAPVAAAPAAASPAAPAAVAEASPTTGSSAGGAAAQTVASAPAIDGEAIYNQACLACHASGAGGAPVVGDAGSWAPRIAKGIDVLHSSGINGVAGTAMMAKGGRADLSDDQVIAAVNFMVDNSK